MKWRQLSRLLGIGLSAALLFGTLTPVTAKTTEEVPVMRERMSISTTYPKTYDDWANGFMCGDGVMGAIVFGDPLEETVVVNHRRFFMAATSERRFNKVSEQTLTAIRKACARGDYATANRLANEAHGWVDGGEGNKHPGYAMHISLPEGGAVQNYRRECDYSTGEITVKWQDDRGDWARQTFVSRADNVMVQRLQKPTDGALSCDVSLGTEKGMHLPAGMKFTYETTGDMLTVHALYPNPAKTGHAGYEGATRVVVKGKDATVTTDGNTVRVQNADEVLLLTRAEHYDRDCESAWEQGKVQTALRALSDEYDTLLAAQIATHGELYDRVCLDLDASAEERAMSNEQLLAAQKSQSTLNPALYERLFDSGRFHYLCSASDIGAPDLLGIWTGDCDVGWSGYYHLDANLNLQISGAIIGNMAETMEGYYYLMDCWADGFRKNASDLLGCRGLLGGGNTPGESSGLISALNYYYPYQYVTGEMAWLLYPYWEYYEVSGDEEFLRERLYPYLAEMGLFYEDFLQERDADGNYIFAGSISPENQPAGLGMSLANNSAFDVAGCRWIMTRLLELCDKFGLEQGAGEGVERWSEILDHLPDYVINEDGALAEWGFEGLKDNYNHRHSSGLIGVWPYRDITPEADAELFDAACTTLAKKDQYNYENAGHGLLHAALIAANLKNADSVTTKLLRFGKEDFYFNGLTTAHYVNRGTFCTDVCNTLPTILMESLVASDAHGVELLPALPTSLASGRISGMLARCRTAVDEVAWNMDENTVEVILTSAIDQTLTVTERQGIAAIDTTASVSEWTSGDTSFALALKAGESTRVKLTLVEHKRPQKLPTTITASSYENGSAERAPQMAVDGDYSTRWASQNGASAWVQLDLGEVYDVQQLKLVWEAAYATEYRVSTSADGEIWTPLYEEPNGKGGTEMREVQVEARYLRFDFTKRALVNGQMYGYSLYELEVFGAPLPDIPDVPDTPDDPTILWGDANRDKEVTTADARLILQYAAELKGEDALDMVAANVNDDNDVTTADARLILQYCAELIDIFPAENR